MKETEILNSIKKVIKAEACSLQELLGSIDRSYTKVAKAIYACKGNLIVVGMGKSGYIGRKIVSTMISVGTKALFLHPSEACHGDLGILSKNDIVLIISNSGQSEEILNLLPSFKALKLKIIAMTARKDSILTKNCDYTLWIPVEKEACDMNLVPTNSSLVSLAIGDALAITLMKMKNFSQENFSKFHPAGSLGKRLSLQVTDLMLIKKEIPFVFADTQFIEIIDSITQSAINATTVVNKKMHLLGLITSYNVRKVLMENKNIHTINATQMMNKNPIVFSTNKTAYEALLFMKKRDKVLNVLPIVENKKLVGILSLQSLLKAGL